TFHLSPAARARDRVASIRASRVSLALLLCRGLQVKCDSLRPAYEGPDRLSHSPCIPPSQCRREPASRPNPFDQAAFHLANTNETQVSPCRNGPPLRDYER